jgi:hypothetical protein
MPEIREERVHVAVAHNNDDDPGKPFLSDLVEDGELKAINTPNGNVHGAMKCDTVEGFQRLWHGGPFAYSMSLHDRKDWDGNRSGE